MTCSWCMASAMRVRQTGGRPVSRLAQPLRTPSHGSGPATGETVWEHPILGRRLWRTCRHGAAAALERFHQPQPDPVWERCRGRTLRRQSGFGDRRGRARTHYGDPVVVGSRAFFYVGARAKAIDFWLEDDGSLGYRTALTSDKGFTYYAGAAYHGRLRQQLSRTRTSAGAVAPAPRCMRTGKVRRRCIRPCATWLAYAAGVGQDVIAICGTGPGRIHRIGRRNTAEIGFLAGGPTPYVISAVASTTRPAGRGAGLVGKRLSAYLPLGHVLGITARRA